MADLVPIDSDTFRLLDVWLRHDPATPGTDVLLKQLASGVTAASNCAYGCGSLELHVAPDALIGEVSYALYPVEGEIVDLSDAVIGGLMLWMSDGRMAHLEIWTWLDAGLPIPDVERVRWRVAPAS